MKNVITLTCLLFVGACQPGSGALAQDEKSFRSGTLAEKAMVSTTHPAATRVGLEILQEGGNAIDAAIAVQFALAVVYPRAGNIGGGGFAVIRWHDGQHAALDFREKAPLAASRDMYLDRKGQVLTSRSRSGHLAVGVPGSVAGMWALHQRYGSMPWKDLLDPAISLAANGATLTVREAEMLNSQQADFRKANRYTPWVLRSEPWQEGELVVQQALAHTLSLISEQGKDAFYKGTIADQIEKEMVLGKGLITKEDLASYEAVWRTPVTGRYKDHTIIGMPPPSSGGVALLQLLRGAELLKADQEEYASASYIHLLAEIEKRVYADRSQYLGDPDFYPVPASRLTNPDYLNTRYAQINREKATPATELAAGDVQVESEETTHFSLLDAEGNAVAITTTLNGNMGSDVMVENAGFFLNNEMDDFSAKPGVPNMFGLVGSEANEILPGKRMLSSMTPTIVEKDGDVKMILGTPGGSTIITSVFQIILNVLDRGMTLQEAIDQPRFHHQWLPDKIQFEEGKMPKETLEELRAMGHGIRERDPIGRIDAILIHGEGRIEGASDTTRSDGMAMGY